MKKHKSARKLTANMLVRPLAVGAALSAVLGFALYQLLYNSFFSGAVRILSIVLDLALLAAVWAACTTDLLEQIHGTQQRPDPGLDPLIWPRAARPTPPPDSEAEPQPEPMAEPPAEPAPEPEPPAEPAPQPLTPAQQASRDHLAAQARRREEADARQAQKAQKAKADAQQLQRKRAQARNAKAKHK